MNWFVSLSSAPEPLACSVASRQPAVGPRCALHVTAPSPLSFSDSSLCFPTPADVAFLANFLQFMLLLLYLIFLHSIYYPLVDSIYYLSWALSCLTRIEAPCSHRVSITVKCWRNLLLLPWSYVLCVYVCVNVCVCICVCVYHWLQYLKQFLKEALL